MWLRPSWTALDAHHEQVKALHLRQLFASDPRRGERLTLDAAGIFLDYSTNALIRRCRWLRQQAQK